MTHYPYIVVGAGTSGSIVARRLADAGKRVLIVEAGPSNRTELVQDLSHIPDLWHTERDWDYYTAPQAHAAGRRIHLPRGRVLGGSHSLNAAIWVRCLPSDFDGWAADGCPGWAWADVEPVYRRIEGWRGAPDPARGTEGLLPIEENQPMHPIQESIIDAAVEWGLERNPDYNSGSIEGVSRQQVTVEDGDRVSTWDAYAHPAVAAGTLDVRTGVVVRRVIVADGRATGLEIEFDGQLEVLTADEIVLAGGTFGSAEVLLRSGIGPAEQLADHGIPLVADLPVGKNLHDHYLVPVIFGTERPVEAPAPHRSVTQSHWFWKSDPALAVPDTQPITFSVPMLEPDMSFEGTGFTLMAGLVTTHSRGEVTLADAGDPAGIRIDPHVLEDPRDLASILASVRQCLEVGAQPALADAWGAAVVYPAPGAGDDALIAYIREHVITYHHQVGTCRMGSDDRAVVDPTLRVRGVAGLTVADASVIPTVTTGNTNAPAAVIGEKAADFLLASADAPVAVTNAAV
ncbi:MAG: GMC family oxidoreductase [Microbacterium ginsengisoli]|uniref:GMC family oxidoreductase n=3 Tax=Microbacteriaceae TaxID=85023 RepID=UPI0006F949FB|nr:MULTISPECIES: GMC family oxidoreductase [unclassified Microbacterium]KQR96874.1 oxidoreductase [Microbacterium sp. Leaf347]MBN9198011.1 GMC family oxidoreductase [Microbacterium ginsengisoli]OJU78582.1 MAG: oxidoreductase [Microbacterium sp. 71-23]